MKSLKKFLTKRYGCDNLVWLSKKKNSSAKWLKKLFKKVLDKLKEI